MFPTLSMPSIMTYNLNPQALLKDISEQILDAWNSVSKIQRLLPRLNDDIDNLFNDEFEFADLELESKLQRLYISIHTLIEAIGLHNLLAQFQKDFAEIPKNKLTDVNFLPYVGELTNNSLELFWRYRVTLSALLGEDNKKQLDDERRKQFESILINTPKIVHDRGIEPSNEAEVRKCVYDLLIHVFPDAVREASIIQNTKTYKPDIGIKSLRTAAEYKFADSKEEVKKAIGGLYEDMRGYGGSEDWKHFFAVVYMTDHFFTQQQIMAEFNHTNADANWTPILVFGNGSRKKKVRTL
jgi:hypothetical protein